MTQARGTATTPPSRAGGPIAPEPSSATRPERTTGRRPVRAKFETWIDRPLASFHLIITVAALLTTLGLVMVLSASSVEAYAEDGSAYTMFTRQAIFTVVGLVMFVFALRVPIRLVRKLSLPLFVISIVMLVLVLIPGIGTVAQGTRGWFTIGGVGLQPSEIAKVTFAVWGAHLLASRRAERAGLKELLIPLVPAAMVVFGLIVLQPDLGTTVALGIILMALLWFAGLPVKVFGSVVGGLFLAAATLAMTAGYRSARIQNWLNPGSDPQGIGYQSRQALYSLADGGMFGLGLGQSRAKWSYLPNAHNDFIFAIIGEELGLVGCVAVIGLFGILVFTGLRIAARVPDPFMKILVATFTVWILAQAAINIGYVVGLLPVTGLQLPLVSAGGTSTAITLLVLGLLANISRHEPEAVAALASGRDGRFGRLLRLPVPEVYSPARSSQARGRGAVAAPPRRRAIPSQDARRAAPQRMSGRAEHQQPRRGAPHQDPRAERGRQSPRRTPPRERRYDR
ncbi:MULTISPECIES: putative lipid II flippase FtsW [unclassified Rhodococcus (in: high G+C Gram-positive bacteria)]|uniref:putative lipid II flippase FtsW n=1 Tax=unclassified Rhodococcus (in: high G+C Gram-positive bacteria) TaxID=192944 RepID=UPI0009ECBE3D|nr:MULTISPECIES: putative lipid II flippase FtsW [unclassified Rhodococcus (in: high G+C Gram-positive bacteria)]